tara:strand:- start:1538 stop:2140 length:603 start_codon:yes stop_codon:yes gene_type:complete
MTIILASKSPRRKYLLEKSNLNFKILESGFCENNNNTNINRPSYYCKELAKLKSLEIAKNFPNDLVIGADTIVYKEGIIYNKPKNKKEAINHLKTLSDDTHTVYTGVSLIIKSKNIKLNFYEKTFVTFYKLNDTDINFYIDKYKPYDKAGAYGIQDWSMIFVKSINGCFNNVIGFPISKFYKLSSKNQILNNAIKSNQIL